MKTRKLFWLAALSIMTLVFAACGGDASTGDGGDTGGDNADAGAVELTQTETIEAPEFGGSISVSYPEGWVAQSEAGAILIGTSEEALAIQDPTAVDDIPAGTAIVNITVLPGDMGSVMGLAEDSSPADVLDTFTQFMQGDDMPEFSEAEEIDLDGTPAARIVGSDDNISVSLYALIKDGTFIIGFGATRTDEAGSQDANFEAIVASAGFTASE